MGNCMKSTNNTAKTTKSSHPNSEKDTVCLIDAQNPHQQLGTETSLQDIKEHHVKALEIVEVQHASEEAEDQSIILLPHQHTLFCERKQRVCGAVGQLQEYETLQFVHVHKVFPLPFVWVRRKGAESSSFGGLEDIAGSENSAQYTLTREDVGHYITVRATEVSPDKRHSSALAVSPRAVGPITPGPPRLLDFVIVGSMEVGSAAVAQHTYIGGFEGRSEYWWMRITADGKRVQVTEPTAISVDSSNRSSAVFVNSSSTGGLSPGVPGGGRDPRTYLLTAEDVGCTLKAKCRPVRSDGAKGEIFTSKSSDTVVSAQTGTKSSSEVVVGGAEGVETQSRPQPTQQQQLVSTETSDEGCL